MQRGLSAHAVRLAWGRSQGPHVIPIPGARTVAPALDSAAAASIELTAEKIAAIDRAEFSQ